MMISYKQMYALSTKFNMKGRQRNITFKKMRWRYRSNEGKSLKIMVCVQEANSIW
jgi:hypothetical protein